MNKLTKEQAIILTAYTGTLCCAFSDFHADVERRVGHAVFTHMFGDKDFIENVIKPLYKDDFMTLVCKPQ